MVGNWNVTGPKSELIMLDEPVAGMTAKERDATAALLEKIAKERSIIIIEHDMDFVAKIADQSPYCTLEKSLRKDPWMKFGQMLRFRRFT